MIHTPSESFEAHDNVASIFAEPDAASITVPDAHLLFTADFQRKGSDLVLTGDDGHKILVADYFRHESQPDLVSPEGALLSASLVELLAGSVAPGQYAQDAQAAAPAAQQPIGRVETVSGSAMVTRNGVAVDLNVGDLVFQGDVVQTRSDSTLGIGFADGSAFSLKENARMALNEFVYDPNSTSNSALINLVQGTVSFIASQVAKTGNMRVETPTATLGIRGTFVTVDVSSIDGHTVASLGLETNATTGEQFAGAFTLTNRITGNQVTVNQVNSMFSVSPAGLISESAKPLAMQAIEQASFQALTAIAAATAAGMGTAPTAPNQFLNDPNTPSGPSNSPAPGGSSGASPAPTNTSPVDNHPTTVTVTTTTTTDTHPNITTATTVVPTPPGPPTPPTVQTTSTTSTTTPTVDTTHPADTTHTAPPPPTITITSIGGGNVINHATAAAGFTISGTETNADGQAVTVKIVDGSGNVNGIITTTASAGTWSVNVSPAQAQALADGAHTFQATVTDQNGNNSNAASQSVTVHQTLPAVTMAQVDGNNIITAANAHTGVTISGTESNADGQTITVKVLDNQNNVVDTLTTVTSGGSWSATLSSAQAHALADGSYTVQATVTDQYGNSSNTASQNVTVEQQPTVTTPTISSNDQAGSNTVREGDVLTASASGRSDDTITYAWYSSSDGFKIAIGTGATYTVKEGDEGFKIEVVATSTNDNGATTTATSAATATVLDALPTVTSVTISGAAQEGSTLTANTTTNDPEATILYQWQSSSDNGHTWCNISGATDKFYLVAESDETHLLRVVATTSDPDNSSTATATSTPTAAVIDVTPTLTVPFSYAVDELTIVKNGTQIYDNTFTQAPPQSPDIRRMGVPSPIEFISSGTWTETGGKAVMSSSNAVPLLVNDGVSAILNTNTQPQSTSNLGLKENAAFTVSATFDLRTPANFTGYGFGLTDGTSTHASDEVVQIVVQKSGSDVVVNLYQADFTQNNPFTLLASQTITSAQLSANDQIQLQLDHAADSAVVTGSFALLSGGHATSTTTFLDADHHIQPVTIFTPDVTWTRPQIFSFATPATVTISDTTSHSSTIRQGDVLTANVATNDSATIHYQWQELISGTWTDISGATSQTYTVQEADEGGQIRVHTWTSDPDNTATPANATSAATATVKDALPTIASVTITDTTSNSSMVREGDTLSPSSTGVRSDDVVSYKWYYSNDLVNSIGSGSQYTVQEGDEGKQIVVVATSTNDNTDTATATSSATATVKDALPTIASVTITDTTSNSSTVREGDTLSASSTGVRSDDVVSYKWYYSNDLVNSIGSGSQYTVQEGDEGKQIVVVATSTNDNTETATATSAPTATVTDTLLVGNGGYATIQAAVDAAANGDAILISAGTYREQVTVSGKHITIQGAGAGQTIIESPDAASLVAHATDTNSTRPTKYAVITVTAAADVTITGVTVDGRDQGSIPSPPTNYDFLGVYVLNSDAHIDGVAVTGTRELDGADVSGVQRNHSILVTSHDATHGGNGAHTVEIENSTVSNFQKDGIFVNGSTLTANIHDNTVTGTHTTHTAQNGIQIGSLFGAGGVDTGDFSGTHAAVDHNAVTDIGNNGPAGSATGIIVFDGDASGVSITNNTVTGWALAQVNPNNGNNGIVFDDSDGGTVTGNTINAFDYGLGEINQYKHLVTPFTHSGNTYAGNYQANVLLEPDTTTGITFAGSTGHDELHGSSGNDVLFGGGGSDTAVYPITLTAGDFTPVADADPVTAGNQPGWQVVHGGTGTDLLNGIEKVSDGAGHNFLLVGNGAYGNLQAAVDAAANGDTLVSGPMTNFEAPSNHLLYIAGNITGTGSIEVPNNATLELGGSVASTQTLSFVQGGDGDDEDDAGGTLILDHSLTQPFSAVISGLGEHDYIDLNDLSFTDDHMTATTSFANSNTTLVVTNTCTHQSVTFTLAGNYTDSEWDFAKDSGTGTIFHDPPATNAATVTAALTVADQFTFKADSQSGGALAADSTLAASGENASATNAATLDPTSSSSSDHQPTAPATTAADTGPASTVATNSQPPTTDSTSTSQQAGATTQTALAAPAATGPNGSDTFVFAANFGHEAIANFHPDTDVIEIDHSVFADFQALLAAAHDDGHGNAVIAANPNDSITIKNVTVAQLAQHQGDFHFT